jgi:hypothetical protein
MGTATANRLVPVAAAALVLAAAVGGACTAPDVDSPVTVVDTVGPERWPRPGPRAREGDPVALNAECERCHADVAEEWRGSLHQRSMVDPTVRHQLEREPAEFCVGCHAPEASSTAEVPASIAELGVACITCHGTDHDALVVLDGVAGCKLCHEFEMPRLAGDRPLLMQSTFTEHAASAYADRSCGSCHMPEVEGTVDGRHKSHRFASSRDPAMVRAAVAIEARERDGTVEIVLSPAKVGHAFPTGDMLRRLAVEASVVDAEGNVIERRVRYLQRHIGFTREPHTPLRRFEKRDDRVGATPGPVVVRHELAKRAAGAGVRWEVRYERVADPSGGPNGSALVEGAIVVGSGELPLKG